MVARVGGTDRVSQRVPGNSNRRSCCDGLGQGQARGFRTRDRDFDRAGFDGDRAWRQTRKGRLGGCLVRDKAPVQVCLRNDIGQAQIEGITSIAVADVEILCRVTWTAFEIPQFVVLNKDRLDKCDTALTRFPHGVDDGEAIVKLVSNRRECSPYRVRDLFDVNGRLCVDRIDRNGLGRRNGCAIKGAAGGCSVLNRAKIKVVADHRIGRGTGGGFARCKRAARGLGTGHRCAIVSDAERSANRHVPRRARSGQRVCNDILVGQNRAGLKGVRRCDVCDCLGNDQTRVLNRVHSRRRIGRGDRCAVKGRCRACRIGKETRVQRGLGRIPCRLAGGRGTGGQTRRRTGQISRNIDVIDDGIGGRCDVTAVCDDELIDNRRIQDGKTGRR